VKAIRIISYWKKTVLLVFVSFLIRVSGFAQCLAPYQSISFDTVITGNGNASHLLNLSQFDPALGTLISTQIHAVVSLNYGFTLKNADSIPGNFAVSVVRNDHIQSSAMPATYDNTIDTTIGRYLLNPGQSISMTPYTILYRYDNADSIIQNQVDFLGSGSVSFNYKPLTYTDLTGTNSYLYGATASDTIHFSVTYYYCSNITLAASLTQFTAKKSNDGQVALEWVTDNEQRGRTYEVQKSMNGADFTTIGREASKENGQIGNYNFDYPIPLSEAGAIYFRLAIRDAAGNTVYSEIRQVDLGMLAEGIFLYPNPSDQVINILFRRAGSKDWTVEILTSNGALIQTNHFNNTQLARIEFLRKLSPGIYFARITDGRIGEYKISGFLVR
jgi:hypothetical protein